MDISVSSNFERYLYYLAGSDSGKLAVWMKGFESTGSVSVSAEELSQAQEDFMSCCCSSSSIVLTMRSTFDEACYLLCPHTATAAHAVKVLQLPSVNTVVLATAHPAKFEEAVSLALVEGRAESVNQPAELTALFALPQRYTKLSAKLGDVQALVRTRLLGSMDAAARATPRRKHISNVVLCGVLAVFAATLFA
jgi:threonine synthase